MKKNQIFQKKGYKCLTMLFFSLLYFATTSYGQEGNTFFTILANNTTLSEIGQQRHLSTKKSELVEKTWIVNINPIQDHINQGQLTITLPDEGGTYTFKSYFVDANDNATTYYWLGEGSGFVGSLKIAKYESGYAGYIEILEGNQYFSFTSLSGGETLLVKYKPTLQENMSCGMTEGEEIPDEDEIDEMAEGGNCYSGNNIRVLVLFTNAADVLGNPTLVAADLMADFSSSLSNSSISTSDVSFSLAGVRKLSSFQENPLDIGQDVNKLAINQEAITHRNQTQADVVLLLTDDVYPGFAGLARGIAVANKNAFALIAINSQVAQSSGIHEIGHLIGARHQKSNNCPQPDADDKPNNNHGFVTNGTDRTIMATNSCPNTRRLNWSNPDVSIAGNPTGNRQSNNANKLRKRATKVSCFQPSPSNYVPSPFTVSFTGPTLLSYTNPYQWNAVISGTASNVSYVWETSPNGLNNWTQVGTGSTFFTLNPGAFPCWFVLKVTATDANGNVKSYNQVITRNPC